ncbi:MAG: hypothetical protein FWE74_02740 [Oscillospiraceae bacterium]|nr:hypothetical protein [Oscillospiraceae bacterium]
MILLVKKVKERLTSNRGELIAETIMSFLVLSILVAAVFLIMSQAMAMTSDSARRAITSQEDEVNPSVLRTYVHSETVRIHFNGGGIQATHTIDFNTMHETCAEDDCNCNNALAFSPQ